MHAAVQGDFGETFQVTGQGYRFGMSRVVDRQGPHGKREGDPPASAARGHLNLLAADGLAGGAGEDVEQVGQVGGGLIGPGRPVDIDASRRFHVLVAGPGEHLG